MASEQHEDSDENRCARGTDISKLAQELDIHPRVLESALDGAAGLLRVSRENVRPADKKALRGVTKTLGEAIDRLSGAAVQERLVEAAFEEPDTPDENNLAHYAAWCAARGRVERAIEGAQDLLALVHAAEEFKIPAGRRPYDHWTVAVGSLLEVWTRELGRKVTISGHAADSRGVEPSPAVRFVHQCMRLLGEEITEQACLTILRKLRVQKVVRSGTTP